MDRQPPVISFLAACRAINSVAGGYPEIARAARSELWHLPQNEEGFREHLALIREEVEAETWELVEQVLELIGAGDLSVLHEWKLSQLIYQHLRALQIGYPLNPQWGDQPMLTSLPTKVVV